MSFLKEDAEMNWCKTLLLPQGTSFQLDAADGRNNDESSKTIEISGSSSSPVSLS